MEDPNELQTGAVSRRPRGHLQRRAAPFGGTPSVDYDSVAAGLTDRRDAKYSTQPHRSETFIDSKCSVALWVMTAPRGASATARLLRVTASHTTERR